MRGWRCQHVPPDLPRGARAPRMGWERGGHPRRGSRDKERLWWLPGSRSGASIPLCPTGTLGNEGIKPCQPKIRKSCQPLKARRGREGSARRSSIRASFCRCPCSSPGWPRWQHGHAGPVPSPGSDVGAQIDSPRVLESFLVTCQGQGCHPFCPEPARPGGEGGEGE